MDLERLEPDYTLEPIDQKTPAQKKLDKIKGLMPSGDIAYDVNNFFEITNRKDLYRKIHADKNPRTVLDTLNMIKKACQEIIKDPENLTFVSEEKKQAEIEAIERLIDFYSKESPEEQKK
jgi:hypothetical protein